MTGDDLIADAAMVFDRERVVAASREVVWPWLVQLGKRRAGWYLPRRVERWLPPSRRALWRVDERWLGLAPGDSVPDYGGPDETLEVARIEAPEALVYTSSRKAASFSWALLLEAVTDDVTRVRLRFRGTGLRSTGPKRRAVIAAGEFFDRVTAEAMLDGLAERVEAAP